jgi:predicted nucleic acid-binding protein
VSTGSLESALPTGAPLLLDTSVVLAYLAGNEATSPLAAHVMDVLVQPGRNRASLSAVTAAEVLVRPFAAGGRAVGVAELFLRHFPNLDVSDVTYEIAREAARIRAETRLPMADALILGSAVGLGIRHVVANDDRWLAIMASTLPEISLCHLGDHVPA